MRVMLVEDHDDLREATLAVLQAHGFDAVGVASAEEVDDTPLQVRPQLYVLDLCLPGEDGLALARRLRAAQPGVGIVMTTARTTVDDRVQGYGAGADIYLPKPVDPQELVAALRALGTRLAQRGGTALAQPVLLDTQGRTLHGGVGTVRLSDSEARMLAAMACAPEGMLERWQVAVHLGSPDAEISPDSLQNRISQLRKKMATCLGEGEFIRAVRKEGYKLCVELRVA